jgi:hypothetical protein
MAPQDPTPRGDEMVRRLPERKFPEAPDDAGGKPRSDDADIAHRPALPSNPERMVADTEDEDADPVVDSGPGIADGVKK